MKPVAPPILLVLAAGMGSRYGGLKQLDPVGPSGETIIDYSIYDALRAGFDKVIFVIRKEFESLFRERVGARFEHRTAVEYVFQELDQLPRGFCVPPGRRKPWGTAHAILAASDSIRGPFAVINADDFYGAEGYRVLAEHLQSGTADQAMVGFVLNKTLSDFGTVSRGICRLDDGDQLASLTELTSLERDGLHIRNTGIDGHITRLDGDELVSMNMWGFTPQVFDWLRQYFEHFLKQHGSDLNSECFLPSMVNDLIVAGETHVKVLRTGDSWFGITYREDLQRVVENVRSLILDGQYPRRLW